MKEAKDLVEKLPATLGKQLPKEKANELKEKLTATGCTISLKWKSLIYIHTNSQMWQYLLKVF